MTTLEEQLFDEMFMYKLEDLVKELIIVERSFFNSEISQTSEKEWQYSIARIEAIENHLWKQERMEEWIPIYVKNVEPNILEMRIHNYKNLITGFHRVHGASHAQYKMTSYRKFLEYCEKLKVAQTP